MTEEPRAVSTRHVDTDSESAPTPRIEAPGTPSTPPALITVPWHPDGTGPVPTADGPVQHRWRKIISRTLGKAWGDSLFGLSAQAAFWCAMSTAPFLLALLGLSGIFAEWVFGPDAMTSIRDQSLTFLNTIFNEEVADNLIGNTIDTILDNGRTEVISVGLIISLWAGSSAISAFVESITIAYGQHEVRHPVVERIFALGLYLSALLAEIVLVPQFSNLFVGGPDLPIDAQTTGNTVPVSEFTLDLTFPPSILQLSITPGDWLDSTGRATSCSTVQPQSFEIVFSCTSTGPQPGPTGSGVLAHITVHRAPGLTLRATSANGVVALISYNEASTVMKDLSGTPDNARRSPGTRTAAHRLPPGDDGDR